jgi:hypothetical protein
VVVASSISSGMSSVTLDMCSCTLTWWSYMASERSLQVLPRVQEFGQS